MKRKLLIPCPQCSTSESEFFKENTCSYCNGTKKVNILEHYQLLNITDERLHNVKSFISDPRFIEYLESKR